MTSSSFAIGIAWSVALALRHSASPDGRRLSQQLFTVAFSPSFYRICRWPARLWGFAAQGVAERGNRVGEADRTELVFQTKSGESGEGSLPPGEWRWR